jgi:pteridine reductase
MLHYNRSKSHAQALMNSFNQRRANSCDIIQSDLTDSASLKNLIETTRDKFNNISHLVNNASVFYPNHFLDDSHPLDEFMSVHLTAPKILSELAFPYLQQSRGSVINLIDIYADAGLVEHTAYVTSKAALLGLSHDLAIAYAPNVRVNCVSPGAILWPPADSSQQVDKTKQQQILDNTALKRLGSPINIAATVCYLALDASYTTGAQIKVDGGRQWYI